MKFPLHHHQIHQNFVDVLVGVVPDLLEQASECVLDGSGGRGMTVCLHGGQMQDVLSRVDRGDLDPFRKYLVEPQQGRLEPVHGPGHLCEGLELEAEPFQHREPSVVPCPFPGLRHHRLVFNRRQESVGIAVLAQRRQHSFQLPGLTGAGGKVFGPGKIELQQKRSGRVEDLAVPCQMHEAAVIAEDRGRVGPDYGNPRLGHGQLREILS